ncbi:MAG: endonuclease/exonuclease/phosphatase family protein [Bacteroidota bacterium]|nr:endonuclease/exonuclease/phosphatase family protein [Bacteroidota bacterium]
MKLFKKLSIFSIIMLLLNIIAVAALIISYSASVLSPDSIPVVAFFGISYPIFLSLNLLFVFYWLFRLKLLFLLSAITILAGYRYISEIVQFNDKIKVDNPDSLVKVVSYNVRYFNYELQRKKFNKRDSILDFLRKEKPDIICFQEFLSSGKFKYNIIDTIKKITGDKYLNIMYYMKAGKTFNYGMSIFSKFPIIKSGKLKFQGNNTNSCIFSDLLIKGDTVRVYDAHLESIRFGKEDYLFVDDINKGENRDTTKKSGLRKIIQKLKRAFIKRGPQTRLLSEQIKKSPYPVIVCGDFNDTPSSYTYHRIVANNNLKDAFVESGHGLAQTYNGIFPSFKIDYILHSNKFKSYNFRIFKYDLSDHYPISCYIDIKNERIIK